MDQQNCSNSYQLIDLSSDSPKKSKCKYFKCNKIHHDQHSHQVNNEKDQLFEKYLNEDHSDQGILEKGNRLVYMVHLGEIKENMNFSFGSYTGKGLPGRELGTVIESLLFKKYFEEKAPFKHRIIWEALTKGLEVHIIVYERYLSDESSKIIESITLDLPFTNLVNFQSRSIDISHLDPDLVENLKRRNIQNIMNAIKSERDHMVFNLRSLEQFIENFPNFQIGFEKGEIITIERLSLHIFEIQKRFNSFTSAEIYIMIKLMMVTSDLKVEMRNSRFRQMIEICCEIKVDYHSMRFKLMELEEKDKDEKEEMLNKIRLENESEFILLEDRFDANLEFIFKEHFNEYYKIKRNMEEIAALEYLHEIEYKVNRTREGGMNLVSNKNRYQLLIKVFEQLKIEFTMTSKEFQKWTDGKRHYPEREQLVVCEYVLKGRYYEITSTIVKLRDAMFEELRIGLDEINELMHTKAYKVGEMLAMMYLNYLESTKGELFRNNYIGERRLRIIQRALEGIVQCNLTTNQIKERIKNQPDKVKECNCTSVVEYLDKRIKFIKDRVKSLTDFYKITTRITEYYFEDIEKHQNKKKKMRV